MLFRPVLVALTLSLGLLSTTATAMGQSSTPAAGFGGDLPEGATYEPVKEGTEGDVVRIAERVAVTRVIQEPEAVTTRAIRHPTAFLVETGGLTFVAGDAQGDEPATLLRADDQESGARLVTPGSRLDLAPGDRLVIPPTPPDSDPDYVTFANRGSEPSRYLEVEIFPSGRPSALLFEGLEGFAVEPLDVALGLATAQEPAPPTVQVSRVALDPDASLPLDATGPALILVEDGTLGVAVEDGTVPVERSGVDYDEAPEVTATDSEATLAAGDAAFISPGVTGAAVAGDAPSSVLVVMVIASSADTSQ